MKIKTIWSISLRIQGITEISRFMSRLAQIPSTGFEDIQHDAEIDESFKKHKMVGIDAGFIHVEVKNRTS